MDSRPIISPGDWIRVANRRCVVANVRDTGNPIGDCEVVFNSSKPTNLNASWNGSEWEFVETGDFGGYAEKYSRLSKYVQILRQGY